MQPLLSHRHAALWSFLELWLSPYFISELNCTLTKMTGAINKRSVALTNEYICTPSSCRGLGAPVVWAQKGRRKAGQQCLVLGVVPVCGGWDRQDRLSSLPPVCCEWIGDYSSRCVIRSELYSWGCWARSGVKRKHLGGHVPQESHFTAVRWMYPIYSLSSSFPHPCPPSCLSMALLGRKVSEMGTYIHVLMYTSICFFGNGLKCKSLKFAQTVNPFFTLSLL